MKKLFDLENEVVEVFDYEEDDYYLLRAEDYDSSDYTDIIYLTFESIELLYLTLKKIRESKNENL